MPWLRHIITSKYDRNDILFHGTIEPMEGPLRTRSHGNILWVAETPDVAQNYIPESGITSLFSIPSYLLNDTFRPNKGINLTILKQMGYNENDMKIQFNHIGEAISWSVPSGGMPKNQDVKNYIESTLGYTTDQYGSYRLKLDNNNVMPASWKKSGTLFILIGKSKLKIFDLTGGTNEDDLMEPTYNKIDLFTKIQNQGYDGFRINDFAQSKNWGNVGHRAIGIFPSGLAKLQVEQTPATNYDWKDTLKNEDTDEFRQWDQNTASTKMNWLQKLAAPINTEKLPQLLAQAIEYECGGKWESDRPRKWTEDLERITGDKTYSDQNGYSTSFWVTCKQGDGYFQKKWGVNVNFTVASGSSHTTFDSATGDWDFSIGLSVQLAFDASWTTRYPYALMNKSVAEGKDIKTIQEAAIFVKNAIWNSQKDDNDDDAIDPTDPQDDPSLGELPYQQNKNNVPVMAQSKPMALPYNKPQFIDPRKNVGLEIIDVLMNDQTAKQEQNSFKNLTHFDSGQQGTTAITNDGHILKYTDSQKEADVATFVMNNNTPCAVKVFSVNKIQSNPALWRIEAERVQMYSDYARKILASCGLDTESAWIITERCVKMSQAAMDQVRAGFPEAEEEIEGLWFKIYKMKKCLAQNGLPVTDIHIRNIGVTNDSRHEFVLLDLG